jgi:NAD(P)-dependent dehydrogenase (short-subunit alcohol dehydrogenase family)
MTERIDCVGQVVLITGAGRGLGAAYARLFAERGAPVVVHDARVARDGSGFDPGPAEAVAAAIRQAGGSTSVETHNLASRAGCEALIAAVLARCGRLDVLVHSAGLVVYKGIAETTDDEWERQLRVNIEAPFWLCRSVWPSMLRQQYGRIVLTASGYGLRAFDGSDVTAYGMGKAAQFGLMNGLAGEGRAANIMVNAVSPVAATRIFRRPTAPDELAPEAVAPAVLVLGSRACPWTGKVLHAAGGRFSLGEFTPGSAHEPGHWVTPEQILRTLNPQSPATHQAAGSV